jgi:O-antigen/teichoic acid export membrane protein
MHSNKNWINVLLRHSRIFFWNDRVAFALIRYGATAAIVIEMLMFARLLGPQSFGSYAIAVQVVGFLALVGAGSGAGYVMKYFQAEDSILSIESNYIFGSLIQYLTGGIIVLTVSLFSHSYLYISSVLLLIQIPYYVSEPILRVRNKYILSAIGRASGSIATVLLTIFFLIVVNKSSSSLLVRLDIKSATVLMLVGNAVGYGTYYATLALGKHVNLNSIKEWKRSSQSTNLNLYFQQILQPSGSYTISSIVFTAFTYTDRFFIDKNYSKSILSNYSLAWQITQSVLLLLTSLNTISGIRIGESKSNDPLVMVKVAKKQLQISAFVGLFCLLGSALTSWFLKEGLYRDYEGLVLTTVILSLGYLGCGVTGSITMLLFFEKQYGQVTVAYLSMLTFSLIGNLISCQYGLPYVYPVSISSLSLIIANVWLFFLFRATSIKLIKNSNVDI